MDPVLSGFQKRRVAIVKNTEFTGEFGDRDML
jgi:hypothetical protein